MIEVTTVNYQCNLEKMFIMNPGSTLKLLYDAVKGKKNNWHWNGKILIKKVSNFDNSIK